MHDHVPIYQQYLLDFDYQLNYNAQELNNAQPVNLMENSQFVIFQHLDIYITFSRRAAQKPNKHFIFLYSTIK